MKNVKQKIELIKQRLEDVQQKQRYYFDNKANNENWQEDALHMQIRAETYREVLEILQS